jgi:thiamine monophosphate synthase
MMTLTQYYLIKLAEEAAEVAQIALKAAHFGLSEIQPTKTETNAERIYIELNDTLAMVHRLGEVSGGEFWFDIGSPDHAAISAKLAKVAHYLAYSQSLGLVESAQS